MNEKEGSCLCIDIASRGVASVDSGILPEVVIGNRGEMDDKEVKVTAESHESHSDGESAVPDWTEAEEKALVRK